MKYNVAQGKMMSLRSTFSNWNWVFLGKHVAQGAVYKAGLY